MVEGIERDTEELDGGARRNGSLFGARSTRGNNAGANEDIAESFELCIDLQSNGGQHWCLHGMKVRCAH